MLDPWRVPGTFVPCCPDCQSVLTFVASWTCRDLWGYREVLTYECASHGPVFVTSEHTVGVTSARGPDIVQDNGDRDSLIPARPRPTPPTNVNAIALPEPD